MESIPFPANVRRDPYCRGEYRVRHGDSAKVLGGDVGEIAMFVQLDQSNGGLDIVSTSLVGCSKARRLLGSLK
jgi:hypothetical protein